MTRVGEASGDVIRIGITDYAQDALGDVVVRRSAKVGNLRSTRAAALGEVESTKSVSEIYAPVGGTVSAVNESLGVRPNRSNATRTAKVGSAEITRERR